MTNDELDNSQGRVMSDKDDIVANSSLVIHFFTRHLVFSLKKYEIMKNLNLNFILTKKNIVQLVVLTLYLCLQLKKFDINNILIIDLYFAKFALLYFQ